LVGGPETALGAHEEKKPPRNPGTKVVFQNLGNLGGR